MWTSSRGWEGYHTKQGRTLRIMLESNLVIYLTWCTTVSEMGTRATSQMLLIKSSSVSSQNYLFVLINILQGSDGNIMNNLTNMCSYLTSCNLAWKIPWTEEPGRLQSMGSPRVRHDWETSLSLSPLFIGEGDGNPLQCSCLENLRDGVAQSRTWLKWLSSSNLM